MVIYTVKVLVIILFSGYILFRIKAIIKNHRNG